MGADIDSPIQTRVYMTGDGRAVIEQSESAVVLSAEQILTIIEQLRACYDYCAAWKEPASESDRATPAEPQP